MRGNPHGGHGFNGTMRRDDGHISFHNAVPPRFFDGFLDPRPSLYSLYISTRFLTCSGDSRDTVPSSLRIRSIYTSQLGSAAVTSTGRICIMSPVSVVIPKPPVPIYTF